MKNQELYDAAAWVGRERWVAGGITVATACRAALDHYIAGTEQSAEGKVEVRLAVEWTPDGLVAQACASSARVSWRDLAGGLDVCSFNIGRAYRVLLTPPSCEPETVVGEEVEP